MARDVGLAEELAHGVLITALSEWPKPGPDTPQRQADGRSQSPAVAGFRHSRMLARKRAEVGRDLDP